MMPRRAPPRACRYGSAWGWGYWPRRSRPPWSTRCWLTPAGSSASRNTRGRGAFPKVRLLQLIECGTHAVLDAAFGAVSEQVLARRVLGSLGAGMLLLGDRNFPSYRLWQETASTGAHLLWRATARTLLPRTAPRTAAHR